MPHEPTHRVCILRGDERRDVSFHPSKRAAFAFAEGVVFGANLAGGDVHVVLSDQAAWRGKLADGTVLRVALYELPLDVVTIPDAEYEAVFS